MSKLPSSLDGVKFEYIQGITFEDGAQRCYVNRDIGVQVTVETPRKHGVWGEGKKFYSLIGSKDFHETYAQLLEACNGL